MPSLLLTLLDGVSNSLVTDSSKVQHLANIERKPALLDNVFQILSAPLFVVIELFDLVGLRTSDMNLWKK